MSLQILQALEFEMESSGDKDPLRMMLLVEKLKEKNLQASSFIAKFNDAAVTENPLNSTVTTLSYSLLCMIVVISIFFFFVILYIFVKVVRMCSQTCGQGMPSPPVVRYSRPRK
jgi:hypothetical protein